MTTTYSVKGPDGHTYSITGPKGASDDEVIAEIIRQNPSLEGGDAEPQVPASVAQPAPEVGPSGVQTPGTPERQKVQTMLTQGNVEDVDPRFMTGDQEAQLIQAWGDPNVTDEQYAEMARAFTEAHGKTYTGPTSFGNQRAEYQKYLAEGGQPLGVQYTHWKPEEVIGNYNQQIDPDVGGIGAALEEGMAYNPMGFVTRQFQDWFDSDLQGATMDDLRQRYPQASDEDLEAMHDAIIGENRRRELANAGVQVEERDVSLPVRIAGNLIGGSSPADLVPFTRGAGLMSRVGQGAALNVATDVALQGQDVSYGAQDEYNPAQTFQAGLEGAGLQLGLEGLAKGLGRVGTAVANRTQPTPSEPLPPIRIPTARAKTKGYAQQIRDTVADIDRNVQSQIAGWENAPAIEVHRDFEKLDGVDNDAIGVMGEDGTIRLNTQNILAEAKARRTTPEAITNAVVFHEALGHYGLAQRFRDDLEATLNDFYENSNASFRSLVDRWMAKHPDAYKGHPNRELRAAEEVLAEMSERGQVPATIINRLKNQIKELLRSMGIEMKFSKREIETILGQAHRAVTKGKGVDVNTGTRYSMAGEGPPRRPLNNRNRADDKRLRRQTDRDNIRQQIEDLKARGIDPSEVGLPSDPDFRYMKRINNANDNGGIPAQDAPASEWAEFYRNKAKIYDDLASEDGSAEYREMADYFRQEASKKAEQALGNRYSKRKFTNRSQFEDTDFDNKIDPDEPVTAYDLDGKLVGRYRNLNQARSLKPDHIYRSESGAFEMGPTGLNEDVARTFLYELGIPTDDLSGYQTMREAIDNRIDDRYIEWFQARPDEDGMYPTKPPLKKYGPKYMKKRSQEGDDLFETQNALDILHQLTDDYQPTVMSMDDLQSEAEARGMSPSRLLNNKALDLGELPRRFMMYDLAAQQLNDKVSRLYHKIQSGQATYDDRVAHTKALLQFKELSARIFDEQGEAGRLLRSIQELSYTRKKIEGLQSTLEDFTDQGLKEMLSDPDAYARFAKEIQDQMTDQNTGKVKENIYSALNIPRAIMSSFDLSAPFRQALPFVGRKEFWKNLPSMFKYMFSEGAYDSTMIDITGRPTYQAMLKANLPLTGKEGKLSSREEAFQSKWVKHVPGMAASERAYNGFLNKLRADVFDSIYNSAKQAGVDVNDKKFLKSLGGFVGAGTGRGNLGGVMQSAAPLLNALFFSPRLIKSRFQLLNPAYYATLHPTVRKEAIKNMMAAATIVSSVLGLAAMAGADVETDPRSSDFGKIKVGNTRYDVGGGFNQFITLGARLLPAFMGGGKEKTATGEMREYGTDFGQKTRLDAVGKFATNKASPIASFVLDALRGEDAVGEEFNMTSAVASRVLPMYVQDIHEVAQEHGVAEGLLRAAPGVFGVGVQNYTPNALDPAKEIEAPDSFEMDDAVDTDNNLVTASDGVVTLKDEAKQEWERRLNFYISEWMKDEMLKPEWKTMSNKEKADVIADVRRDARRQTKTDMLPLFEVTEEDDE